MGGSIGTALLNTIAASTSATYLAVHLAQAARHTAGRTLPQTSDRAAVELLANADVEPDADGDGFGDETQDNCPTIPNDQTTNPCAQTGQVAPTPGSGGPAQADTGEPTSGARVTVSRRHRRRHRPHGTTFHVPSADLG